MARRRSVMIQTDLGVTVVATEPLLPGESMAAFFR